MSTRPSSRRSDSAPWLPRSTSAQDSKEEVAPSDPIKYALASVKPALHGLAVSFFLVGLVFSSVTCTLAFNRMYLLTFESCHTKVKGRSCSRVDRRTRPRRSTPYGHTNTHTHTVTNTTACGPTKYCADSRRGAALLIREEGAWPGFIYIVLLLGRSQSAAQVAAEPQRFSRSSSR